MSRLTEKEYPLTIEILVDKPCGAALSKGQICKAKHYSITNKDLLIFDIQAANGDGWSVPQEYAKVIKCQSPQE